jgi:hypothetical protein
LEFLAVRSRPNTVAAVGYDLKVFFTVVGKPPAEVAADDVLAFVTAQYTGGAVRRLPAWVSRSWTCRQAGPGGCATRGLTCG